MDQFERYLNLSYRYLTIRNRSEKEIRDYLARKNAPQEIIDRIVTSLIEKQFLNDEAFALAWIRHWARIRPKGKYLLKRELQQKGIADEIILKVLDDAPEEIPDELVQAKSLIGSRLARLEGKPRQEIYAKVGAFLSRRGFKWAIIKRAIDDSLENGV